MNDEGLAVKCPPERRGDYGGTSIGTCFNFSGVALLYSLSLFSGWLLSGMAYK